MGRVPAGGSTPQGRAGDGGGGGGGGGGAERAGGDQSPADRTSASGRFGATGRASSAESHSPATVTVLACRSGGVAASTRPPHPVQNFIPSRSGAPQWAQITSWFAMFPLPPSRDDTQAAGEWLVP